MDRQEIVDKVIETVAQVQDVSGRVSTGIGVSTRPVGGLEGFDSYSGVEATMMLSESLKVDLPMDYNPFVSSDGERALSVGEIADNLSNYVKAEATAG